MSKSRETVEALRTVVVDADIGSTVQGYDATIVVDADIGTTVLSPTGDGSGLTNLPAGGATSINGLTDGYNDASSVGLGTGALANDDGTANLNTAVGTNALNANTTGYQNTAIGYQSLTVNTTGIRNTASGYKVLRSNTTGSNNTGTGYNALQANTTGTNNTGTGYFNLFYNSTGSGNTSNGYEALRENTTGSYNTALGDSTLRANSTGTKNTASGYHALYSNTTGGPNTATGYQALRANTTGSNNTASGAYALYSNTTGAFNTASGHYALGKSTTPNYNTASGYFALGTNTTGASNAAIGHSSTSSSATASGEFTLGGTATTNLRCNDTSISSLSDERDKTNITDLPDSAGLDIINALRPVTFNWDRREWYDNNTPDGSKVMPDWRRWKANSGLKYGFIAQEVQATIANEKCMADSMIVTNENLDKLEFAPQHLLTNAIKAIQQLSTENEALKIRLTALENA